jgi:hypothetical protein
VRLWIRFWWTIHVHVVREYLPRVTSFHYRLGLSLSKHIRHRLIVKINDKRRPRTCEALNQILDDYSRARRVPVPILSPYHATRGPTGQGERARICLSIFSLIHTLTSV